MKKLYKNLSESEKALTIVSGYTPKNAVYQLKIDCEQDGSKLNYCDGACEGCLHAYVVPV